jgi:hypothetical protein
MNKKETTFGLLSMYSVPLGNNDSYRVTLKINPYETRQTIAVPPIIPLHKFIPAIADLCSAILAIISVTIGVFTPTIPTPAALSGLPNGVIYMFLIRPGLTLSVLGRNRILLGRQPEKGSGYQHYKNDYSSFQNIFPLPSKGFRGCYALRVQ